MKKIFARITAIICVVAISAGLCFSGTVYANDMMFDLNSLGITKGVNVENRLDSNVTRGEFSQLVVNMMGQQEVAMSMSMASRFTDTAESPYAGAINLLYEEGIVSGIGDGTFMPDRNVRYVEACKMLVKALGYDVIVEGNSLDAFTYTAGVIGVTDHINTANEYITMKDMLIMLNNCLDIDKMVPMYYNPDIAPSYEIDKGNTFRNDLSKTNPDGIVKMRGVVTADVSTYLYSFNPALRNTQLEIEGQVFNYNGIAPLGYVGVEVDFYISTTNDGTYGKITSIKTREKNVINKIDGNDVASYSNSEIKYYVTETKTEKVKTDMSTIWIYNNDLYDGFNLNMVNLKGNADIRTIDNDEDEIADVVFVFEYVDCVVSSVNAEFFTVTLENGYYYKNEKNLNLNEKDTKAFIEYYDEKGVGTTFDAIKEGSVLSVAKSADGLNIRIVICNKEGQGLVEMKDGDYITIGVDEFYAGNFDIKDINLGYNYTYKLNYKEHLVYVDEIMTESNYAYVYEVQSKNLGDIKVKLIIPAAVSNKTVQGEFDEITSAAASSKNLYVRNENILVYNVASKFTYEYWTTNKDGEKVHHSEKLNATVANLNKVLKKPVKFDVDKNNNINKFSMPEPTTVGYRLYYNSSENVFGQSNGQPFAINDKTYALCIPTNADATTDDMLNYIQELLNATTYYVDAYDVDETLVADLIVTEAAMISGSAGSILNYRTYSGIVTKSSEVYDPEKDETSIQITMLTKGNESKVSEQTFTVSPLIKKYADFKTISRGDYIAYSLDGFDRLNSFEIQQPFNGWYERTVTGAELTHFVGTVVDIEFDRISNRAARWMDYLTVNNVNGLLTYELMHNSSLKPVVYIMNDEAEVQVASVSDIAFGDTVYIFGEGANVYAIVILR